jgi:hypothetical protein
MVHAATPVYSALKDMLELPAMVTTPCASYRAVLVNELAEAMVTAANWMRMPAETRAVAALIVAAATPVYTTPDTRELDADIVLAAN